MNDTDRDALGRVVRDAWIRWAKTRPDPKPSWLVPYDELSEPDKEADRQIAEAVLGDMNARRIWLAEKKSRDGLTEAEAAEFNALQEGVFAAIEVKHPGPPSDMERIEALERRLSAGGTEPQP
jgi:hypothetical protein